METLKRLCKNCEKPIIGRTDKKFCNDNCRNNYHNLEHHENKYFMQPINKFLHRNRRIMAELLPKNAVQITLSQKTLLEHGFLFQYFTHQVSNKSGKKYNFCYDYGYQALRDKVFRIVKRKIE